MCFKGRGLRTCVVQCIMLRLESLLPPTRTPSLRDTPLLTKATGKEARMAYVTSTKYILPKKNSIMSRQSMLLYWESRITRR